WPPEPPQLAGTLAPRAARTPPPAAPPPAGGWARERRRRAVACRAGSGHGGDVRGHGRRVRTGHELRRHRTRGSGGVDLVVDDLLDRLLLEMLSLVGGESAVEIGPDRTDSPGVGELVTAPALRDEELLPLRDVPALGDPGLLAPTARRECGDSQQEQSRGEEAQATREAGSRLRPSIAPRRASGRS